MTPVEEVEKVLREQRDFGVHFDYSDFQHMNRFEDESTNQQQNAPNCGAKIIHTIEEIDHHEVSVTPSDGGPDPRGPSHTNVEPMKYDPTIPTMVFDTLVST